MTKGKVEYNLLQAQYFNLKKAWDKLRDENIELKREIEELKRVKGKSFYIKGLECPDCKLDLVIVNKEGRWDIDGAINSESPIIKEKDENIRALREQIKIQLEMKDKLKKKQVERRIRVVPHI